MRTQIRRIDFMEGTGVADLARNRWPKRTGLGGRFEPESVAEIAGIRTFWPITRMPTHFSALKPDYLCPCLGDPDGLQQGLGILVARERHVPVQGWVQPYRRGFVA